MKEYGEREKKKVNEPFLKKRETVYTEKLPHIYKNLATNTLPSAKNMRQSFFNGAVQKKKKKRKKLLKRYSERKKHHEKHVVDTYSSL